MFLLRQISVVQLSIVTLVNFSNVICTSRSKINKLNDATFNAPIKLCPCTTLVVHVKLA